MQINYTFFPKESLLGTSGASQTSFVLTAGMKFESNAPKTNP